MAQNHVRIGQGATEGIFVVKFVFVGVLQLCRIRNFEVQS